MRYYFAPLEGITDGVFRAIHHRYYPGLHRYYTPFLSPTIHRGLTRKELREIPPAESLGYQCVPQLLTKNTEDFVWLAEQCLHLGYHEVNLNLGCPSGTVTAKGKGSGMLRNPDDLDRFLDGIFSKSKCKISIKTRIGFSEPDEFPRILDIYNNYPICELIIHPRVRNDFYNGSVHQDAFIFALQNSRAPLCYNGDILTLKQAASIPGVNSIMIGRGLIANPGMHTGQCDTGILMAYLHTLLDVYSQEFGSARNAMFRLKEHWHYLQASFPGSEKLYKQLRKTTDASTFIGIMNQIIRECPFAPMR